jgi:FtsP/CotA-like multicopper oxidase with cupredoxin domain
MISRRSMILRSAAASVVAPALLQADSASGQVDDRDESAGRPRAAKSSGRSIVTPDGESLGYELDGDVKVFRLTAERVEHEFAPGVVANCWGYNGRTPGPTIEAVEGDRIRVYLTNHLPEPTAVHWHGVFLPNGMDGVGGLTQPHIQPGETFVYEFTLRQHGTQMYHPHSDEMLQMAMGMMGFFIIHPKDSKAARVDRDFAIFLHEWFSPPGAATPDPMVMLEFNTFTFNGRAFPGTSPLLVKTGDRVRIRIANLTMDTHPIHLHGFNFRMTGTDGGPTPSSAQFPQTTVNVPVGATRDIEFIADAPGDWALHCHKSHHTMNAMAHDIPNMLGVEQTHIEQAIRRLVPGYMAMGEQGMGEMQDMNSMRRPANTPPMMAGDGPFGNLEMGGMFTVLKVRDSLEDYEVDPGWYEHPPGTVAWRVS